ncbi:hypothetical protein HKCCE4037_06540 [Rhodobacterales bacterium HKCCE4037]|nr:hypothetical protein [Rhodobacterales bacterium HKCCE4037]
MPLRRIEGEEFREDWMAGVPLDRIARKMRRCEQIVNTAARKAGFPPRTSEGEILKFERVKAAMAAHGDARIAAHREGINLHAFRRALLWHGIDDPGARAQSLRFERRPGGTAPNIPATIGASGHRRWNAARDLRLAMEGSTYAGRAALAKEWNLPAQVVDARWHLIRVAA